MDEMILLRILAVMYCLIVYCYYYLFFLLFARNENQVQKIDVRVWLAFFHQP